MMSIPLAGIGLGVGHQLRDGVHRQRRGDRDQMRPRDQSRHPCEPLGRIEIQIGKQHGVIRNVWADDEQRVAVRRRGGDSLGADRCAAARAVLDDDVLADPALKVLGDDAGEGIDRPAGGERYDQLDGLCGVVLRLGRGGGHREAEQRRREYPNDCHSRLRRLNFCGNGTAGRRAQQCVASTPSEACTPDQHRLAMWPFESIQAFLFGMARRLLTLRFQPPLAESNLNVRWV